ncbi:MAG: disulfide bond formation protein DsbA, partial [Acidobacteriaceae bacterium]
MKSIFVSTIALTMALGVSAAVAQSAPQEAPQSSQAATPPPLPLSNVAPSSKLEFPAANPKNFTASSPTVQAVNAFLKQLWGYDPNRVWRVMAIENTEAPNVSQVVVLVGEQGVSHQASPTVFFVTPDGEHAIAGTAVVPFGAHPFSTARQKLELQATGP